MRMEVERVVAALKDPLERVKTIELVPVHKLTAVVLDSSGCV
jgi:hypothetical protein